jgi:hypothetical protein
MFSGRGAPYLVIGMVVRYVAEVDGDNDNEPRRVCCYFRYSLTVYRVFNKKSTNYENA